MDIAKMASTDMNDRYMVTVSGAELHEMAEGITHEVMDNVASRIADDYIKTHGDSIIACISPKIVLNKAIAKIVSRLSD